MVMGSKLTAFQSVSQSLNHYVTLNRHGSVHSAKENGLYSLQKNGCTTFCMSLMACNFRKISTHSSACASRPLYPPLSHKWTLKRRVDNRIGIFARTFRHSINITLHTRILNHIMEETLMRKSSH